MKYLTFFTFIQFLTVTLFSQNVTNRNIDNKCVYKPNVFKQIKQERNIDPLFNNYDVNFYMLDINMERTSTYISGNVVIQSTVINQPLSTFVAELHSNHFVDSVYINGQKLSFVRIGDLIKVSIPSLSVGSNLIAQIYYHGTPPSGYFFSGMTYDTYGSNHVVWSLSEPYSAYEWWPCKQALKDKADSAYIFVTTSNTNKVGSNGILTNVVTLPGNKVRYEWKTKYPIDYYLISVAISNYFEYNIYAKPFGYQDSILIQNYIYNGGTYLTANKTDIDRTAAFLELFSEKYGLYPFHEEKYGNCVAPLGGGMEHQTMTTLYNCNFLLNCHELSHQWFGDNVTCSNWQDIWLNEGFATYSEYIALENLSPGDEISWLSDVHTNVKSLPDGSVYLPATDTNDVWRIFDGRLSYDKGAALVHMIRYIINNDSLFFVALKNYQTTFQYSTASSNDLKTVLEATTGIDFTAFFNEWLYGEGYPIYEAYWRQDPNNELTIEINQSTSAASTPLFTLPLQIKLYSPEGDSIISVNQTQNTNIFQIPFNRIVSNIDLDPNNYIIKEVSGIYLLSNNEKNNNTTIKILSNPVRDYIAVYTEPKNDKKYNYLILNNLGQNISRGTFLSSSNIDVKLLSKGTYTLVVYNAEECFINKIIKL